jgi:hypothetical protein
MATDGNDYLCGTNRRNGDETKCIVTPLKEIYSKERNTELNDFEPIRAESNELYNR